MGGRYHGSRSCRRAGGDADSFGGASWMPASRSYRRLSAFRNLRAEADGCAGSQRPRVARLPGCRCVTSRLSRPATRVARPQCQDCPADRPSAGCARHAACFMRDCCGLGCARCAPRRLSGPDTRPSGKRLPTMGADRGSRRRLLPRSGGQRAQRLRIRTRLATLFCCGRLAPRCLTARTPPTRRSLTCLD